MAMRISDEDVEEFRQLYREDEHKELTDGEAREILSGLLLLFERFADWIAQEKARGTVFEVEEPPVPSNG